MEKGFYITICNTGRYYGISPFKVDEIVKIVKNCGNGGERSGIRVTLPMLGTIGTVAVGKEKTVKGTTGAEILYKKIGDFAYAHIVFITEDAVIAKVLSPKEVKRTPYLKAYRKKKIAG